jgi:hypothetical protein
MAPKRSTKTRQVELEATNNLIRLVIRVCLETFYLLV